MPSPLNITNIPAPRVEFIDPRTGLMAREWYRFFLNLFTLTGSGSNPTSLEDLQLDSPTASEIASLDEKVYALTQDAKTQLGETKAQQALDLYSSLINSVGLASLGPAIDYTTPKNVDNTDLLVLAPAPRYDNSIDTNLIDFEQSVPHVGAVGRLVWNDTDGTLNLGLTGGNVTLQIGQEQVVRVVNKSGANLIDGQVVYLSGAQGNRVKVDLAVANGSTSLARTVLGLVTEPIANNQEGFVTISGLVRGLNTSAFVDGDVLYLSTTPGAITNVKPTPPIHAVIVGFCVNANPVVGSILVSVSPGYDLEDLSDVEITTRVDNDLIRYDAATQVWKNTATGTGVITALGINVGTAGSFVVNGGVGAFSTLTVSDGGVFSTVGTVSSVDAATPNNGTTGGIKLRGNATSGFARIQFTDSTAATEWGNLYAVSSGLLTYSGTFAATVFSGPINGTIGATTPNTGAFTSLSYTTTLTGGTGIINLGSGQFYKDAAGNVGIGTAVPGFKLEVVGNTYLNGIVRAAASSSAAAPAYTFAGDPDTGLFRSAANTVGLSSNGLTVVLVTPNSCAVTGALTATGSIGYGTGSGGAVTQLISRTTGVTLDKINGAITMFSAAGSATAATFTVTNSTVVATDTIVLSVKSSTNVYLMFVTAVAAGSFNITFQTTGGTAVDAPVINFAVIKAVVA